MTSRSALAARAAPGVFVLVWSTGFVGAKYGLPYADPFTLLALRLALASALLALLAVLLHAPLPRSRDQLRQQAVTGILLHGGYLGGVFWAISRGLPAGIAAVVVSLQPVLTAVFATRLLGERLTGRQGVGLSVGVVGVALVVGPGVLSATGTLPVRGLLACTVALLSGTAGTLWQKRHGAGTAVLGGTAVQYATTATVLLVAAVATEPMRLEVTPRLVIALAWMVLPLSLGAVLLLYWLLRRGTAARVSSLYYLVPPATAFEAYLMFGERLAPVSLVGVAVVAVGVALVVRPVGQRQRTRSTAGTGRA